jgi:hypothetical protein
MTSMNYILFVLMSRRASFPCYNNRNHFPYMVYISRTFFRGNCSPEISYALDNSSLVVGFTVLRRRCFNSCHNISMGLRSGLSAGVGQYSILLVSK